MQRPASAYPALKGWNDNKKKSLKCKCKSKQTFYEQGSENATPTQYCTWFGSIESPKYKSQRGVSSKKKPSRSSNICNSSPLSRRRHKARTLSNLKSISPPPPQTITPSSDNNDKRCSQTGLKRSYTNVDYLNAAISLSLVSFPGKNNAKKIKQVEPQEDEIYVTQLQSDALKNLNHLQDLQIDMDLNYTALTNAIKDLIFSISLVIFDNLV